MGQRVCSHDSSLFSSVALAGSVDQCVSCLFFLILLIIDVEVAHLVRGLVRGNDAQEVSQLLGLQVLLAQIFQVTLRERRLSSDMDLSLLPVDADLISQVASLSFHLDAFQQELLEILGLNDVVIRRLLT